MKKREDQEAKKISEEQKRLFDLINHEGWPIARQKLVDRIIELQSVSEYIDTINTGNAEKLLKEMRANKRSAEILFDWLREIEGTAQQEVETRPAKNSYVVELED